MIHPISKIIAFMVLGVLMTSCIATEKNHALGSDRIEKSPNYRDGKFQNATPWRRAGFGKMWNVAMEYTFGDRVDAEPSQPIPLQHIQKFEFYIEGSDVLRFARLGHSTILLQMGGKVWITDPIFSKRASPVQWAGPKRFHPVPIALEDLPPIEGVILSHNHFDHLDYDTILQLKNRANYFLAPLGVGETLASWGIPPEKIKSLDWWENTHIGEVEFVATPAQHFSGRGLFDADETLWASWVLRTSKHAIYFSGDTGYFDGFKKIGEKYGPFEITFLENGAYHRYWRAIHMMPEDTMQAFKDLKGKLMVPIHNGTFDLSLHSWYDPMERIAALAQQENVKFLIPYMGQIVDGMHPPETIAWWKKTEASVATNEPAVETP